MNDTALQWWDSLRHGGLLISPPRLAEFFAEPPPRMARYVEDRLRRLLTRAAASEEIAPKLQTEIIEAVLEDVSRLQETQGFRSLAGPDLDASWSRPSLTGEALRPRRVLKGPYDSVLPVFVEDVPRIGVGHGRRAVSRAIEWLRGGEHRLALVTNARQWRLVYAGPDYDAWAEWDADLWFEGGEPGPQVEALRTLLAPDALAPRAKGERSRLIAAIEESRRGQAELSSVLGERVRLAVELLIQSHGGALSAHRDRFTPRDIYLAATRVVMRMVVVLFAEARELLPRENPIYYGSYGLQGLRDQLERAGNERLRHGVGAWPRVLGLFSLVHDGSHHEALPILHYGGGLFRPGDLASSDPVARALAVFESADHAPTDDVVEKVLDLLCRTKVKVRQGRGSTWIRSPVDFSDLSSEYIGILYEGLLDFELRQASFEDPMVFLGIGDEPALPLSRLDAMDDAALKNLLNKFKQRKDEGGDEDGEDEDEPAGAAGTASETAEDGSLDEAGDDDEVVTAVGSSDEASRVVARVDSWARRAAVAGGLVKKPKSKKGDAAALFERELAARARQLVRRVVLPGEWFLVRWGGTRKGAGTFYTRPQLAVPTVQRTLRPLLFDPPRSADGTPDEHAPAATWTPKRPEEILAVRVCDPAMGSGSFLVAALRFVTEALYASLHVHHSIAARGSDTVLTLPEGRLSEGRLIEELLPGTPDDEHFEARLKARLKRHVVLRCLYGVDLDGLAVELARLALWIETMDRELPFEFLDHRLKRGNSLVGCWFDRFRHYPVLAWEREGGDTKHDNPVHFAKGARTDEIKAFKKSTVYPALVDWLSGQLRLQIDTLAGPAPGALRRQVQQALQEMAALPLHDPEARAALYEKNVEHNAAYLALRERFDVWCALWFWPVDQLDEAPLPGALEALSEKAHAIVKALREEHGFFHWELEFPDVFTGEQSGFEAMVGNPPWDTQKPRSQEFFSNLDPLYRTYGKQEALKHQHGYFVTRLQHEREWLDYNSRFNALTNWCRCVASPCGDGEHGGKKVPLGKGVGEEGQRAWSAARTRDIAFAQRAHPFQYQGGGDANTYKLFLEEVHALLALGGSMGMIVPSGIYSDKGTTELRRLFLEEANWTFLYSFQNERFVFEGIHHSFKMAVIAVVKGGRTKEVSTRFRLGPGDSPESQELETDLLRDDEYLPLTVQTIERLSPRTRSLVEIRNKSDLSLLMRLHDEGVPFGDDTEAGWQLEYYREFHMGDDAGRFQTVTKLEGNGFRESESGMWINPVSGERAYPFLEGRGIDAFHCFASHWCSGKGRTAVWKECTAGATGTGVQYLLPEIELDGNTRLRAGHKAGVMDVTSATNTRTVIAALIPSIPTGDSVKNLRARCGDLFATLQASAVLNSFVFDFAVRTRMAGVHLSEFVMVDMPMPKYEIWPVPLLRSLVSLSATHVMFAVAWVRARRMFGDRSWRQAWAVSRPERLRLSAICDAFVATKYGLLADT